MPYSLRGLAWRRLRSRWIRQSALRNALSGLQNALWELWAALREFRARWEAYWQTQNARKRVHWRYHHEEE